MENIDLFYNRQTKNEIKNNFLKSRIASIVDTIKNEKTNQKKLQAFVCLQSLLMQAYAPSADQDTQGFSNNQQNPNTQLEEINRLKEELDREKSTCEYSQSALNKSLTERNSLTKHIIDLESQISGLQSQMRTLASLREEKKSLEIRLNTEQENYKTTAQRLREEIAYLNATAIIRVQEKASYLENKITTLKAQLSLTLAEKSNLEKEYDNKLTEAKKNFENQIQTLQEKYNALVKEKGATTPLVTNGITRQNTSDQSNKTQIIKSQNSGYKNYYLLMSSLILLAASAATTYRYGLIDVTNLAALRYKVSR
jgi:chromosome segregation ATPase